MYFPPPPLRVGVLSPTENPGSTIDYYCSKVSLCSLEAHVSRKNEPIEISEVLVCLFP